jgi:putative Mg2+ transporter-C (MgtC) family protein
MYDWIGTTFDLAKLLLSAFLGGIIGFEREAHGQAAGFRTYLIVSTGACLMMLLSLHMEEIFRLLNAGDSVVRVDPARIASYAIASMGFLGAGAIIKGKGSVRGLTTAAGLWVVTGIGLSIGAGYIVQTVFTTFLILTSLYLIHPIRELAHRRIYSSLTIRLRAAGDSLERIRKIIAEHPTIFIQYVNFQQENSSGLTTYRIRVYSKEEKSWEQVVKQLAELNGVEEIKWEESDVP